MAWRDSFFNLSVLILIAWFNLGVLIMEEQSPTFGQSLCQSQSQFQMLIPKSANCCTISCSNGPLNITNVTHLSDFKQSCTIGTVTLNPSYCPGFLIHQCSPMPRIEDGEFTVYCGCQTGELVLLTWIIQSLLGSEVTPPFATQIESSGTHLHT